MRFKLSPRVINQFSYYSTSESIGLYNNRSLNVCLFGHHQSGKTVLCSTITKLLSKVNSTRPVPINLLDSNEDEKKLGSTINLSFAPINTGNTKVTLIDSPGRDDLINVKIQGLNLAHIGILVVSNDHTNLIETINYELTLAKHFNLKEIILFLNDKTPVTSDPIIDNDEAKKRQIQSLLNEYGYRDNLIVSGKSIQQLINHIDQYPIPQRNIQCPLFMKIVQAKVFSRNDAYILGYLEKGKLEVGQNVTIIGKGREFDVNISKIVSSPMGFEKIESGHLCELMIRGDRCKWITKGMVVTEPGIYQANDNIDCLIKPFPISPDDFKEKIENLKSIKLVYSDQISSRCFITNINHNCHDEVTINSQQSTYLYKCNLKLSHSLILSNHQPIALGQDKKLIALGQVDSILTNLKADDKLKLFIKV